MASTSTFCLSSGPLRTPLRGLDNSRIPKLARRLFRKHLFVSFQRPHISLFAVFVVAAERIVSDDEDLPILIREHRGAERDVVLGP
jgi:hypothetical protein